MFKDLQKSLKKMGITVNESVISMILGVVVVVLVGLLAYGYFKNSKQNQNLDVPAEITEGEITNPTSAVALPTTHKVVEGETLWSIAEKYYASGYNYQDIAVANSITDASKLEVGMVLTIPNVTVRLPLTASNALEPTITQSRIDGDKYVVLKGDNLWIIAIRAYGDGYRWVEIARVNNLANPDFIHAGNVLQIPR